MSVRLSIALLALLPLSTFLPLLREAEEGAGIKS